MNKNLGTNSLAIASQDPPEAEVFIFPTSFAQQRLWFLDQLVPGNPFYNVSIGLRLTGLLNFTALEQTFNEIVRRHETLRTNFVKVEGQPMQAIAPTRPLSIPIINLQHLSPTQREIEARRLATIEAKRLFNLSTDPLFRVTLLSLTPTDSILLLNLHHIITDGWSMGVLIREVEALYSAFVKNIPSSLPDLPLQYADFAEWQRDWLQGEQLDDRLTYWRQQLNGLIPLNLPTNRPRPVIPSYQGAKQSFTLSPSLSQAIGSLCQQEGITLFMFLLAAFQILLYRYTGLTDIAVGSPIANRNRQEIEGLIGFFVNNLVLRTDLSGNPTFRDLLKRVKEITMGAYAYQDLPFEKLVEELNPERNLRENPLFQVSFSLQNTPMKALELPNLTLNLFEFETKTSKIDLEFNLWEDLESIKGQVIYSTDLFDEEAIARTIGHYQTLLEAIVINPQQFINDLPLLTDRERQQLLIDWNATERNYPQVCFHQLFEAQVERFPQAIAVMCEGQKLTYRELNNKANQLAQYLQKLGVKPEVLVGICLERSLDAIVALLGIMKAGGVYLPLDPFYPQSRIQWIIEEASISILITQQTFRDPGLGLSPNFSEFLEKHIANLRVVYVDRDRETIAQHSPENPIGPIALSNLAYIIYTSGSTGEPKGVLIEHRGLSNLAQVQVEVFNIQPSHRILQFASFSFDASIFEIVMALANGATLYLTKPESLLLGESFIQFLRDRAITHATLPPAVLKRLPYNKLPALTTIISAGEPCLPEIVQKWAANRQFFNAYGPTEATVWSCFAPITNSLEKPPIGRPIANTQLYLLDAQLQPVPIGIPGELYIGGHGLGRGYLNRPDLTANGFIPHPWSEDPSARLYKTGDLAIYRSDGNLEFIGRIDDRVKIRGYRIELGEIEAALTQHPAVREAVAIVLDDPAGNQRLIAYLVLHPDRTVTTVELRNFLKEWLPTYAIPNGFAILKSLPLTVQGKIDRQKLPTLENLGERSQDNSFIAPRTLTEVILANLWRNLLNRERVSIRDNFFDLGGDSLLVLQLIEQIQKEFKQRLLVSDFFLNPTIESLATLLDHPSKLSQFSPLVAISSGRSASPFFCIHPIFGVVFPYFELASHLGKDRPFYGLQPQGMDGKQPPLRSIEEMATYYLKAVRAVQPEGPYYLGGWSFGGLVAFEMAQQLKRSGHSVALLAILDTLAPLESNQPSVWEGGQFLFQTGIRYIWPFLLDYFQLLATTEKPFDRSMPKLNQIFGQLTRKLLQQFHLGQATLTNSLSEVSQYQILQELTMGHLFPIFQANSQATLRYQPSLYTDRITLFRASESIGTRDRDRTLGWRELTTDSVDVIIVPGNHLTMLRQPHVTVLANRLRQCLERRKQPRSKDTGLQLRN